MKIYKKIKINMTSGKTMAEESFEYNGPLALAVDGASEADGSDNNDSADQTESPDLGDPDPVDQSNFENALQEESSSLKVNAEGQGYGNSFGISGEVTVKGGNTTATVNFNSILPEFCT